MELKKRFLFILRHAPYGSSLATEGIDAILSAGIFNQDVAVLFMGDGIYMLLNNQHSELIGQKNISSLLQAMELYGVTQLFVDKPALESRGLNTEQLVLPVTALNKKQILDLIHQQDILLNF